MAEQKKEPSSVSSKTLHPGSSTEDAKALGGVGDFGVAEGDVVGRTYTSANTKRSDPGATMARSGEDNSRVSGVGGSNSGPGSSSGGDLDTDVIGVGTGIGVSASGVVDETPGPDDATGTSADFASGAPAKKVDRVTKIPRVHGSTVATPDDRTTGPQGADAASRSDGDDDSFSGEVSSDEASGSNDSV